MSSSFEIKTSYMFGVAGHLWYLFLAVAVVLWVSPLFKAQKNLWWITGLLGAMSCLVSLCLRFSYHGVEIDTRMKYIREYTSILGFKIGEWEPLPDFEKLQLTTNSHNTPNNSHHPFRGILYNIVLVTDTSLPNYVISITDRKEALEKARALADLFHLQVEDKGVI